MEIPATVAADTVMAVHPTQLYEVALMLGAFMLLWSLRRAGGGTGWIFGLYLALAGIERFIIEFVRAKDDRFFGPFTVAQVTSVILIVIGVTLVVKWRNAEKLAPGEYLGAKAR